LRRVSAATDIADVIEVDMLIQVIIESLITITSIEYDATYFFSILSMLNSAIRIE